MSWSFVGLIAAGCGQFGQEVGLGPAIPIIAALLVGGAIVHTQVPRVVRRHLPTDRKNGPDSR
jgi:hypothetical protein